MTTIIYKIISDFGECRAFTAGDGPRLGIRTEGANDGIISIGNISARTKDGVCTLNLSSLPDGDYAPLFVSGGRTIRFEKIRKLGEKLTRPPLDFELMTRILMRLEALELRFGELDDSMKKLAEDIHGHAIFG